MIYLMTYSDLPGTICMSTSDRISLRWRDRWAAPFNAAAFERLARRYFPSPGWARFYAIVGVSLAVIMFLGACVLLAFASKSLYLETYGIETPGRILHVSFHTDGRVKWKKMEYVFKTLAGDAIKGQLDRPISELKNVPDGDRFTMLYWDRLPSINTPRGANSNFGIMAFIAAVMLLTFVNYFCLTWRVLRWRKRLVAGPPA
jgi:hypothetical protein